MKLKNFKAFESHSEESNKILIEWPTMDPIENVGKYKDEVLKSISDTVMPHITSELESYITQRGYEVLDSSSGTLSNFFESFLVEKSGYKFAMSVTSDKVDSHEGTHDFDKSESFYMYLKGHSLGEKNTMKEQFDAMDKYVKMRTEDEKKGLYSILWYTNYHSKFEELYVQKVKKEMLKEENLENLEDALQDFYDDNFSNNTHRDKFFVKTLVLQGVEHQWRMDRGLVKK